MSADTFSLSLERVREYQFKTNFGLDRLTPTIVDEPEPLGQGAGPNGMRLLGAAVGNCLSASLLFCLEKSKMNVARLETDVTGFMQRNDKGRLRIGRLEVHIRLEVSGEPVQRVARCLELFEEYCTVTASVRRGIDVDVIVTDTKGSKLYGNAPARARRQVT
jgi:uncharacterized OsmC-like protein